VRRHCRLLSAQYWAWLLRKVLGRYQYHPILASIGQYPIPQYRHCSNPNEKYVTVWIHTALQLVQCVYLLRMLMLTSMADVYVKPVVTTIKAMCVVQWSLWISSLTNAAVVSMVLQCDYWHQLIEKSAVVTDLLLVVHFKYLVFFVWQRINFQHFHGYCRLVCC